MEGLINKMKSIHKDPNRVLFPKSGNSLASSLGTHSTGGGVAASLLSNKRLTLPFLVLLAALAVGLLFLLPGGLIQAQAQDSVTIEYAENGTAPVTTLTATDPEMDTVAWSLVDADGGTADLEIGADDGVLKFSSAPNFEAPAGGSGDDDNTYSVTVTAADGRDSSLTDTFTVTVEVTDVPEEGKVTWTVDADGAGGTHTADTVKLTQFQVGASLMASVTDGDVTGAITATWQWYRSTSKTSQGTAIPAPAGTGDTYAVTGDDVGSYIRVVANYLEGTPPVQRSPYRVSDYPVLAVDANAMAPEFDPTAVDREVDEGDKGMEVGAPVTATKGHGALNYTLGGTDVDKFEIDQKTGQITTMVDLDRETTLDTATEFGCGTGYECTVAVTATDSAGTATGTAATVTITLKDVNDPPTFSTEGAAVGMTSVTVVENSTDLDTTTPANVTYTATDPEEGNLNLSLMGADGGLFRLSNAGVLSFRTAPDFENPTDANRDNVYEVTVRASDGTLDTDRMVRVTVTDANEAPMIVEFDGTIKYAENGTAPVTTLTATDPEMDTVAWSLVDADGGTADLEIGADDGVLKFSSAPNFEAPAGGSGDDDNTYSVTVTAADGRDSSLTDTFTVTVEVTDVPEEGKVTWTVDADGAGGTHTADTVKLTQFQVGASLMASVTDGDVTGAITTTWQWYRSTNKNSQGTAIPSPAGTGDTYEVTGDDVGKYIRVVANYFEGTARRSPYRVSDYPVLAVDANAMAPEFDPTAVDREVDEGDKGMEVGAPVTATKGHGALNYTLGGTDVDKFEIDQKTGQITTMVDLDRETTLDTATEFGCGTGYECTVAVTATDSAGTATGTAATVTITLKDVNDPPTFSTEGAAVGMTSVTVVENSTDLDTTTPANVTYTATDPEEDRVNLSLMGADGGLFRLSNAGVLSFRTAPDFENPTDANRDNVYEVTVRASDGTLDTDRMVRVTVTDANEAPMIVEGNVAPMFASATITREVAENTAAGQNIGDPVMATDANRDDLTYSLGGTDGASFRIMSSTGQLMTRAALDYESKNSYMVTVTAMDPDGLSASIDVTIMVTDVMDEQQSLVDRYDAISNGGNGNGKIDLDEARAAVGDYFAQPPRLTEEQVREIVGLYFEGLQSN